MTKLQKLKESFDNGYYKAGALTTVALLSTSAHADPIDVGKVVKQISDLDDPINKIGAAVLGISVVILGWRIVRNTVR